MRKDSSSPNSEQVAKRWLRRGAVFIILAAILWGGWQAVGHWQKKRLIHQAHTAFESADYQTATLCARRVLQLDKDNIAATRVLAALAERAGLPQSLIWRSRVVELQKSPPNDDLERLVRASLRHGQLQIARDTLSKFSEADRQTPVYHELLGALNLASGQWEQAEAEYRRALDLDPDNPARSFTLISIQLQSPNADTRNAARAEMHKFAKHPQLGRQALRALLTDQFTTFSQDEIIELAKQLANTSDADFNDHLLNLDILKRAERPEAVSALIQMQGAAANNAADAFKLVSWMVANSQAPEAIAWVDSLPEKIRNQMPLPLALADALLAVKNWEQLASLTRSSNWDYLDFLRCAYLARALKELDDEVGFKTQWNLAVSQANRQSGAMSQLAALVNNWGWTDEVRDLLWTASRGTNDPMWALRLLYHHYSKSGDTAGLHRTLARIIELEPESELMRNNYAMLSLLLRSNTERAFQMAEDAYKAKPDNPALASTYACALWTHNKPAEALAIMQKIPADKLLIPPLAAWYGIILAANGDHSKAAHYLDLGETANLLPEERKLLQQARDMTTAQTSP